MGQFLLIVGINVKYGFRLQKADDILLSLITISVIQIYPCFSRDWRSSGRGYTCGRCRPRRKPTMPYRN